MRRKRDRECFNGEDFEKKRIIDYCPCTDDDWECDFGFFRKNEQSECLPITKEYEMKWKNETKPENCKDFYEVISGFRKIPGDYCMGGIDKGAKRVSCHNNTEDASTQKLIIYFICKERKKYKLSSDLFLFNN